MTQRKPAIHGGRGNIRGGMQRSRTTVRFLPEHEQRLRDEAHRLGLPLGDVIVMLSLQALGETVPDYIQEEIDAAQAAREIPAFDFSERRIA